ncbi:mitochondrial carrier domain-containing protein [Suillus ampliporus]|nr:mitochondrial carrier domain-containing protein [Suillus ampliporus]
MDPRHGSFPEGGTSDLHPPTVDSVTVRAVKDIAFGSIAGMVAEVFEYPFDLAKVRLQSQVLHNTASFGGPLDCLTQTWRDEGVRGLYRGLPVPIFGAMAETASLFVAYSQIQSLIRWSTNNNNTSLSTPLTLSQLGLAAGGAGFLTSFILTPVELIKCKMQVQMLSPPLRLPNLAMSSPSFGHTPHRTSASLLLTSHRYPRNLPGPFSIISKIGHTGTILRETGGTAVWFASKEFIASALLARRMQSSPSSVPRNYFVESSASGSSTALAPWESALSGAFAGGLCVLALYPADTIKSAIQTVEELRPPDMFTYSRELESKVPSFWSTAVAMYKAQAGCGMTVARAIPCSGIVFVVYDGLSQRFGS